MTQHGTQQHNHCEDQARNPLFELFSNVDKQVPWLACMGLAFWMTWNTVGFSGSFWLHDITNSLRAENLVLTHLVASFATLVLVSLLPARITRNLVLNRCTWFGTALAVVGTVLIVITRESLFPSRALFNFGCVLSGFGTTLLFFRGMSMLGALSPRRALLMLLASVLVSSLMYLYMRCCSNLVATALFVLLPVFSASLYMLHVDRGQLEQRIVEEQTGMPCGFGFFLLSIVLCSAACELIKAYILIGFSPVVSTESSTVSSLVLVAVLVVGITALIGARFLNVARYYSIAVSSLVLFLVVMALFAAKPVVFASLATLVCTLYNSIVWAMLAYIVYQSQSNAMRYTGLGNAALSLGTVVGSVFAIGYQYSGIADESMRFVLAGFAVIVLFDVLFVFNERHIGMLLLPLDESAFAQESQDKGEDRKGRFVMACEQIAHDRGLSTREREVFVALARGWTPREFAEHECLSIYTVRAHIRSVYSKLDVHSTRELRDLIRMLYDAPGTR